MTDEQKPLPAEQPTEHQKATNGWWFPVGTRLRVKEDEVSAALAQAEYTVVQEPWLADEHDSAWTVRVHTNQGGHELEAFVTQFVRVRP